MSSILNKCLKYQFLFEELVKRDFKKKYKRAVLGILWSMISPLAMLLIMSIIFGHFFGGRVPHYTIYLLAGQIVWGYYSEATNSGMNALNNNSSIFSKMNIPKFLFVCSINVSSLINFILTFIIFLIFTLIDGITFKLSFFMLIIPIICLVVFNYGIGLILSALYIFYKDIQYLYKVFLQLLMYCSAIFYTIDILPEKLQVFFYLNPIYVYITYFREIVVFNNIPSLELNVLAFLYALLALFIGMYVYKRYNYKFLYYI